MQLREIKISELNHFIHSELYKHSINIPITKQRAISQIKNPRAKDQDVALIIAINDENQIVGFIGALPDNLNNNMDIYWNSCWWIDPKKGKKTAIPLLLKFLKVCNNKVMLRDMTDKTRKIITRLNKFEIIKNLDGFRYFIKLNSAEILPKRKKIFGILKPILFLIDFLVNTSLKIKNKSFRNKNIQVKYLNFVDIEAEKFINKQNKKELFKRGKTELNWILKFPWVRQELKDVKNEQFYYFSDTSKKFENYFIKIYNNSSKLIGVLLLNNHNGLVKIPYVYFEEKEANLIVQFIYQFLEEQQAISFLTFNAIINKIIQENKNPFWKINEHNKEFVVSKSLVKYIEGDFDFQDGEGDYVFT